MAILEQGKKAYYEIFKHILEHPTRPFIVHCTAGKDRTGVFAMLVFKLLGINDEIIAREYELTHVNTKGYCYFLLFCIMKFGFLI